MTHLLGRTNVSKIRRHRWPESPRQTTSRKIWPTSRSSCLGPRCHRATTVDRRENFLSRRNGPNQQFRFLESVQTSSRRSEEHTSELQSRRDLVCRLLLEKK